MCRGPAEINGTKILNSTIWLMMMMMMMMMMIFQLHLKLYYLVEYNLVRLRKHMKIGHVLGKWCLWTYEAEPAPPGKASFGKLSVSIQQKIQKYLGTINSCISHRKRRALEASFLLFYS